MTTDCTRHHNTTRLSHRINSEPDDTTTLQRYSRNTTTRRTSRWSACSRRNNNDNHTHLQVGVRVDGMEGEAAVVLRRRTRHLGGQRAQLVHTCSDAHTHRDATRQPSSTHAERQKTKLCVTEHPKSCASTTTRHTTRSQHQQCVWRTHSGTCGPSAPPSRRCSRRTR
jgi:hypothetical protein